MNKVPSISAAFREIVSLTEAAIIADTSLVWEVPKKVYFMHANLSEINLVLADYTKSATYANKKFPLVTLVRDIEDQQPKEGQNGFDLDFICRILIVSKTEQTYRADKREEKNFIPVLHPILWNMVDQITKHPAFKQTTVEEMQMRYTDRYFWGANIENKNVFNDLVDAVEIRSMSIGLYGEHCTFTNNF